MIDLLTAAVLTPTQQEFIRRAAELGVRCWCVGPSLTLIEPADNVAEADPAALRAAVLAAAGAARLAGKPVERNTPDRTAPTDLLAFPDAAGVLVVDLSGVGVDRDRFIRILTHYHADLARVSNDAVAIEGFNEQLSQSYEEINLIYRMAKLLASGGDPREVVRTMCEELRGTLAFGWLAMVFDADDSVLEPLRGTLSLTGAPPWPEAELRRELSAIDLADLRPVLTPEEHPLAARAGSELLAGRVMCGDRPIGLLIAGDRQAAETDVTSDEIQLVGAAAGYLGLFHQNAFRFAEQRQQFLGTLNALSAAVDAKDPYTAGHSQRVGLIASQLAARIGFPPEQVEAIRVAGLLHDIGKIGVPEAVLTKPGRLDEAEFALIKKHPETGYEILKDLPSLASHLPGVLHHHERWDGRGYPHGLSGETIPMIARILALADTFDAMSSNRAYRKAIDRDHVLGEMRKSAGAQFDPDLVEPFVTLDFTQFDRLLNQ